MSARYKIKELVWRHDGLKKQKANTLGGIYTIYETLESTWMVLLEDQNGVKILTANHVANDQDAKKFCTHHHEERLHCWLEKLDMEIVKEGI